MDSSAIKIYIYIYFMVSPYDLPLMEQRLKVMMFCVKVPVLSEKMYLICPSSSFSVVVLAWAGVSLLVWYIFLSQSMQQLFPSRRISTLHMEKSKGRTTEKKYYHCSDLQYIHLISTKMQNTRNHDKIKFIKVYIISFILSHFPTHVNTKRIFKK